MNNKRLVEIVQSNGKLSAFDKLICTVKYIDDGEINNALCKNKYAKVGDIYYEDYLSQGWSILKYECESYPTMERYQNKVFKYLGTYKYYQIIGKTNIVFEFENIKGEYYTYPLRSGCVCMIGKNKNKKNIEGNEIVLVWRLDIKPEI